MTSWIQLSDGRAFDIAKPRAISIDVLAESLSRIARFTGHTRHFYSVAQHSVLVSRLVPDSLAAHGLLHDAGEAVLGDISTPLKDEIDSRSGGWLRSTEHAIHAEILRGLGLEALDEDDERRIKHADGRALCVEVRDLVTPGEVRFDLPHGFAVVQSIPRITRCWAPDEAAERFLERWAEVKR